MDEARAGDRPADDYEVLIEVSDRGARRGDAENNFIAHEAGVAAVALARGRRAVVEGDVLSAWMYVRLMTETGIRLRWIAGTAANQPDRHGEPAIDRDDSIARIAAMAKRDYLMMLRAYASIRQIRIDAGQDPMPEDRTAALQALADRIPGNPAPMDVKGLADISPVSLNMYAEFRNSSSVIHPGAALGRVALGTPDEASMQLELSASVTATLAWYLFLALG